MKTWQRAVTWAVLLTPLLAGVTWQLASRGPAARSARSFDEIRAAVDRKSAAEVARMLGEPDTRQPIFDEDEKWIWWNYTFLDGNDYPPEKRGRVVHLEIVFKNPSNVGGARRPYNEWKVDEAFGVNFKVPSTDG